MGAGLTRTYVAAILGAALLSSCGPAEPLSLPGGRATREPTSALIDEVRTPAGGVRIAYPDVPAAWAGVAVTDTAATDLAMLWSLPLFRYDAEGQLVPGLAAEWTFPTVPEGWVVELTLAPGAWSDGSPVTARDAAATIEVLRELRPGEWSALRSVEPVDDARLRLRFDEPFGRWAHLLTGPPGVLPAGLLSSEGLDAYGEGIPVSGGQYVLDAYDPGRSAVFTAHPDGALGAPGLARVEVLFVPSYETALGLLDRGEVDVVLGHLALNPVARAMALTDVRAGAPLGGTMVTLEWLESGSLGRSAELRRAAVGGLDLRELVAGLLSDTGAPATSPVPGIEGSVDAAHGGSDATSLDVETVLLVPRWHEALGFTSRAVQRDLTAVGATTRLVTVETPDLADPVDPHDGALRIRRAPPRPALGGRGDRVPPGPADVVAGQLAPVFEQLADEAWETPLYRIGVAHAWSDRVSGVEPSSWPGLGLWSVGGWSLRTTP